MGRGELRLTRRTVLKYPGIPPVAPAQMVSWRINSHDAERLQRPFRAREPTRRDGPTPSLRSRADLAAGDRDLDRFVRFGLGDLIANGLRPRGGDADGGFDPGQVRHGLRV